MTLSVSGAFFVRKRIKFQLIGNKYVQFGKSEKIFENPLTNGWKIGIIIKSLQDDMSY